MPAVDSPATPLWLLYEEEVAAWIQAQPAAHRHWLEAQSFRAERCRVVLLATGSGAVAAAVAGLGKRGASVSLWLAAGIAERLPAQRFRLQQTFSAAESTQLCLGFSYAAYRFERYRRAAVLGTATLEVPTTVDGRYVALAADS